MDVLLGGLEGISVDESVTRALGHQRLLCLRWRKGNVQAGLQGSVAV